MELNSKPSIHCHPHRKHSSCREADRSWERKKKQTQDSPEVTISYRRPGVKVFSVAVTYLRGKFSLGNCISISNRT